ncbi:EAL domain-containing protein [Neiella marina]|uniref:EAL domain-containing protein n=1 Tax=Neiella holothuriorum TaxID=2870530 RepID=A0ABS7EIA1_9GAMM|nr:EAL domain-containing protein [Neiella holothuriorum]MBW8192081.1 EAL domain-containing protein [Neiella holothuriorum]
MPLNRRALFALIPPLAVAFIGIAYLFYQQRTDAIQKLERARAEFALANVHASIQLSRDHLMGVEQALLQSPAFVSFLQQSGEELWSLASRRTSEQLIATLANQADLYYSLVVLDRFHNSTVMVETSLDPFADHLTEERMLFKRFADSQLTRDVLIYNTGNEYRMALMTRVEPLSLHQPLPSQLADSVVIAQVLSGFALNDSMAKVMARYGKGAISFNRSPKLAKEEQGILLSQPVLEGHTVNLLLPSSLLNDETMRVLRQVSILFATVMLLTLLLMALLIRLTLVRPIQDLESAIKSNELDAIRPNRNSDVRELYSLKRAFLKLYRKLKMAHEESHNLALTDSLTGLPNRLAFTEQVNQGIEFCREREQTACLLFIDLDNFKFVNDSFGHKVGDELLIHFAHQLSNIAIQYRQDLQLPSTIQLARLAGDEFAILILANDGREQGEQLATDIIELFSSGFELGQLLLPVRASIGIAQYPQDAAHAGALLSNADAAMYQAKQHGKNQYRLFSQQMAQRLQRRKEIEESLRNANLSEELTLAFMPVFSGVDLSRVVGAEVLLRWNSPALGAVEPSDFIPIAEACGVYRAIDHWVVEKALSVLPELEAKFGESFKLCINVSAAELKDHQFSDFLRPLLKQHQPYLKNIELEITETFQLEWTEISNKVMQEWADFGISLAIDDFGTGYTSIKQLSSFPINTLKVDRSFTDEVEKPTVRILMESLIRAAEALNLNVTIEGVETETQLEIVQQFGQHALQGHLFCSPISLEQLLLSYHSSTVVNERAFDKING